MARVLVACEFSGVVRDAFLTLGHDAISCDLLPTERPGPHIQGDVLPVLREPWDMVIAHPPCTRLSSVFWSNSKRCSPKILAEVEPAIRFFKECLGANAPLISVENPTMHPKAKRAIGRASCVVQPWHFGHPYTKRTLLWLRGLPPLLPTEIVKAKMPWVAGGKVGWGHCKSSGSPERSKTFSGIAEAMADQWGPYLD